MSGTFSCGMTRSFLELQLVLECAALNPKVLPALPSSSYSAEEDESMSSLLDYPA